VSIFKHAKPQNAIVYSSVHDMVKLSRETMFFLVAILLQTKEEGVAVLRCFCSFVGTELFTRSWRPSHDCG
jgi:hypothetical protein